jgi:MFS family permease
MTDSPGFRPRAAWSMTALLTVLASINFLDKIVLGMVAVPLIAELRLSAQQFGLIAGSFFWLFSVSTVVVGFLSNRVRTRWILLAMGIGWAVLQVPQALTQSAVALLVCRVILGAAEGPSFPVSVHALYKWFPDKKRNLPVAIVNQGAALGLLLAGLVIPLITQRWGWRMNFVLLAVVGCVWSLLWLYFGREGNLDSQRNSAHTPREARQGLPYRRILTDSSVISVFFLGFASYWALGQSLSWLPIYLEKGLGFTGVDAGRWFAVVIGAASPVNIGLSWLSQRMLERGATTRQARAKLVGMMQLTAGAAFLGLLFIPLGPVQKVVLYALAGALPTLCFTLAPALLAEMVPQVQRGALVAIHTALASLGAAAAPVVMGRIVQTHGGAGHHAYELGLATGAVLLIVSALAAMRWLHPARSRQTLDRQLEPASA